MDVFTALSVPTRRSIIEMLAGHGRLPATAIADKFQVTPSAISQHLKVLLQAKLVRMEKKAQQRIYTINPDAMLELQQWAAQMAATRDKQVNTLDTLLDEELKLTRKERSKWHVKIRRS